MNASPVRPPAPATAKEVVLDWIADLGDFPPGLASCYYSEGGHTAYLQDNDGNVSALYLRPFGEGIGGWEIVPQTPQLPHHVPSSNYWGPDPIQKLRDELTAKYDTTPEKD